MIGPYDITLCGKRDKMLYFKTADGKKKELKDSLSKKDLAMKLKIGAEDAKVFREETWLLASELNEWTFNDAVEFWLD